MMPREKKSAMYLQSTLIHSLYRKQHYSTWILCYHCFIIIMLLLLFYFMLALLKHIHAFMYFPCSCCRDDKRPCYNAKHAVYRAM